MTRTMNIYILLFGCTVLFFCQTVCVSQPKKQIKQQIETGFIPSEGKKLVSDQSETVKSFDERGNLIEERNIRMYENQQLRYVRKNYYGGDSTLDSSVISNNDKPASTLIYTYSTAGTLSEIKDYRSDGKLGFISKYLYDSIGNKFREEMYYADGKLYNYKLFKYNKNHDLIEESGFEGGQQRYLWQYTYNKKRVLTKRKDFIGQGQLLRTHDYRYDDGSLLVQEDIKNAAGSLERVVKVRYEFY